MHCFYLCGIEETEAGVIKGNHYLHKVGELGFLMAVFRLHCFPSLLLPLGFRFEEKAR